MEPSALQLLLRAYDILYRVWSDSYLDLSIVEEQIKVKLQEDIDLYMNSHGFKINYTDLSRICLLPTEKTE